MSAEKLDLWPDDFGDTEMVTPLAILKQQAALLGKKTRNILEGEVRPSASPASSIIFRIIAPALGFAYELFSVDTSVTIYPVRVTFQNRETTCEDEESFIREVERILHHEHTMKVIQSLIAQSRQIA